jgi:hypothetical protein
MEATRCGWWSPETSYLEPNRLPTTNDKGIRSTIQRNDDGHRREGEGVGGGGIYVCVHRLPPPRPVCTTSIVTAPSLFNIPLDGREEASQWWRGREFTITFVHRSVGDIILSDPPNAPNAVRFAPTMKEEAILVRNLSVSSPQLAANLSSKRLVVGAAPPQSFLVVSSNNAPSCCHCLNGCDVCSVM